MLLLVGLILGAYVEVQMLALLGKPAPTLVKGAAAMNMGLTGLLMVALVLMALSGSR